MTLGTRTFHIAKLYASTWPSLSGTPAGEEILTCDPGVWALSDGVVNIAFQWRRDGVDIGDETASTLDLGVADVGALITCLVTASDDTDSSEAESESLGPVAAALPVAAGALADQVFGDGQAIAPIDVAADFTGVGITYALAPSSASLPDGLSLSVAGVISGTPTTVAGEVTIVVRGTNGYGYADTVFGIEVINIIADTLDLTSSLPSQVSFSRIGSGYAFNASGVLIDHPANSPRFDHDPATLAARGLLVEAFATNKFKRSEALTSPWSTDGVTLTAGNLAPDGATSAQKLVSINGDNNQHRILDGNAINYSGEVTIGVMAKADEWGILRLTTNVGGDSHTYFDLTNGTVLATGVTHSNATIEELNSGWYLCSVTKAAWHPSDDPSIAISDTQSTTANGDGVSGALVWGLQAETGSSLTSYIPTTSAEATRAADAPLITGYDGTYDVRFTLDDGSEHEFPAQSLSAAGWWPVSLGNCWVKQIEVFEQGTLP